ncbi:MAG: chemotaxis protein CheA [Cyclobacteriaceae bacterium]|nr:chemotaxis protein CheA [Cyclobacteriaceae bacterium]
MSKEEEYKEMFYAEAFEHHEELDKLFTVLEKNPKDNIVIDNIFRVTHTLKGNAMGLGFVEIAELSHVMEDIFSEVKSNRINLSEDLFNDLFKACDKLGALIDALKTSTKVSYKGIRTKLEVYLKKVRGTTDQDESPMDDTPLPDIAEGKPEEQGNEIVLEGTDTDEATPVEADLQPEQIETAEDITSEQQEEIEPESEPKEEPEQEEKQETSTKISFSDQVQIPVKKLDSLLNLVGELIIEKDSLIAKNIEKGSRGGDFSRLHRITSDLQYGVMDIRLVQVGFMFNKFHRVLRDVASIEKKKVNLKLEGTEIEIDRNVLKIMSDSLVHMVRNSVSHGIESPEERKKKGKPEVGTVTLSASNEKDTVIIEISDDGNGINPEAILAKAIEKGIVSQSFASQMTRTDILMLIFEPGFSNAEKITEVSGRGVGMDVVKRATESIGGKIDVKTEYGKGTTISLSLPSSMAVKGALLFEMAEQQYAAPLSYTEAVVSLRKKDIHKTNRGLIANYLDKTISVVFLSDLFKVENLNHVHHNGALFKRFDKVKDTEHKMDVLIVSYNEKFIGLVVDKLLQQKEIVEKTLSKPLDKVKLFSGATILGNGNVCMVLDIAYILRNLFRETVKG